MARGPSYQNRMSALRFLILVLACLGPRALLASGSSSSRPIVAVFPIEDETDKIRESTLRQLSHYLQVRIAESGAYVVVARDEIDAALRAQKAESYRECYESSCQIEIGRELAAQKVLHTQIVTLAGECVTTSTLYDLRLAAAERAFSQRSNCDDAALVRAIEELIPRFHPEAPKPRVASENDLRGGLFLKTAPEGASVRIDGELNEGKTPLTIPNLKAGRRLVEVRLGDLGQSLDVEIPANEFIKLDLPLEPLFARVRVISTPAEAKVELNGKPVGVTPLIISPVRYGQHELRLSKPGHPDEWVTLSVDGDQEVARTFQPGAGLSVRTSSDLAAIFVNGHRVGTGSVRTFISAGRNRIAVELADHEPKEEFVEVVDVSQDVDLHFQLEEDRARREERERFEQQLAAFEVELRAHEAEGSSRRGWIGFFAGLAMGAGAGAMYGVAQARQGAYQDQVLRSDVDRKHTAAVVSEVVGHVLGVAALTSITYSIVEWMTGPSAPVAPAPPDWYGELGSKAETEELR